MSLCSVCKRLVTYSLGPPCPLAFDYVSASKPMGSLCKCAKKSEKETAVEKKGNHERLTVSGQTKKH